MFRRAIHPLLLLVLFGLAGAHASDVERFAGHWRGVAIDSSDGFEVAAQELSVTFGTMEGGFELKWNTPGGDAESARFLESKDQPGMFSAEFSKGGFLGFFSSDELDPLAGDPLTWARTDGDTYIVYKLVINDEGGFTLDRYARTLQNDVLRLDFTRRAHGEPVRSLAARLERGE